MALTGIRPLQNFVENGVQERLRTAVKVSTFHINALINQSADPVINTMLGLYQPVHTVLININSERSLDKGSLAGNTQTVNELLTELVQKQLPAWQQSLRNTYAQGSAEYKSFFPDGNYPFHNGGIDSKISAVKTLKEALLADGHVVVNGIGASADAFHTLLVNARSAQEGKKTEIGTDVSAVQTAIKNMCILQFGNYGGLIQKYAANPETVAAFIDFSTLSRREHSTEYDGTVNGGKIKKVCTHTFTQASTIVVNNTGNADFRIWVAESSNDVIHPQGIMVPKLTDGMVIQVKNIGNTAHRVLMVENLSPAIEASFEVYVGTKNSDPLTDPHD